MVKFTSSNFTWNNTEKLDEKSIVKFINSYLGSVEKQRLDMYTDYYHGDNTEILQYHENRKKRRVTPNNCIPTGYFSTLVDTVSGYMFGNVQYVSKNEENTEFIENLNSVLSENNVDIKDMISGINALAFNKAVEIVYTTGDGINTPQIKFTPIDPRQVIIVYNTDLEPEIHCAIRFVNSKNVKYTYDVDVIYNDEWQYYSMVEDKLVEREPSRQLFFNKCPVVIMHSEILTDKSPFDIVLPYIIALDNLITGNSDDIDKLTNAILTLTKKLDEETLKNLKELKVIAGMDEKDRAAYIEKNDSPEFRQYVSKLLINEIHKHSHVVDWYNPDSGISGEASAKALRTRLYDMDMYTKRIEKVYKHGIMKRLELVMDLMNIVNLGTGDIDVIFNREVPSEFLDLVPVLNSATFISDQTKLEKVGLNVEKEMALLEEQKKKNVELFMQENRINQDNNKDNTDEI